jgi:hypothetical protein
MSYKLVISESLGGYAVGCEKGNVRIAWADTKSQALDDFKDGVNQRIEDSWVLIADLQEIREECSAALEIELREEENNDRKNAKTQS